MATAHEYPEFMRRLIQRKLDKLFARAREQFFPDWDSKHEWQIVAGQRKRSKGETGYCSSKEKRIYIDPCAVERMPEDGQFALIIHEICHDVTTAHHTERWVRRMEAAAKTAETLSEAKLASIIRRIAYGYTLAGKPWREKWCKYLFHRIDWGVGIDESQGGKRQEARPL